MKSCASPIIKLLVFLVLAGCQNNTPPTKYTGIKMTVPYKVLAGKGAQKTIDRVFDEIDTIYNQWNPESEISRFNNAPVDESIEISSDLAGFFTLVDKAYYLSEGRYDPTVDPIVTLWKKSLEQGVLPDPQALTSLKKNIGWNLLKQDGMSAKKTAALQCNFDGIAKGYLVDRLVEELKKEGYHNIYVEWGGEIRTQGTHPEGRPWRVMITGIGGTKAQGIETIELVDQAIASSGDYYQQWNIEGTIYTHIIDATTGKALEVKPGSIASATVIAPSCAIADALATTCLLFPTPQKAEEWAVQLQETFPEIRIWLVKRN